MLINKIAMQGKKYKSFWTNRPEIEDEKKQNLNYK
jgi:hypothetical protein